VHRQERLDVAHVVQLDQRAAVPLVHQLAASPAGQCSVAHAEKVLHPVSVGQAERESGLGFDLRLGLSFLCLASRLLKSFQQVLIRVLEILFGVQSFELLHFLSKNCMVYRQHLYVF
jgi:hypothetical protein